MFLLRPLEFGLIRLDTKSWITLIRYSPLRLSYIDPVLHNVGKNVDHASDASIDHLEILGN